MEMTRTCFKDKLARVREVVERAAAKSGRKASDIALVAVTKGVGVETVLEAIESGLTLFGENRVQEAESKIPAVQNPSVQWHLVGHLQSNKVRNALSLFSLVQSVDSLRLAEHVSASAIAENKTVSVLLEVNLSGEKQKYGFESEELYGAVDQIALLPAVKVEGLMGIAPNVPDLSVRRDSFRKLKGLYSVCKTLKRGSVEMKWLSMGMSDDYEVAIEEGANMIRVGRALFR